MLSKILALACVVHAAALDVPLQIAGYTQSTFAAAGSGAHTPQIIFQATMSEQCNGAPTGYLSVQSAPNGANAVDVVMTLQPTSLTLQQVNAIILSPTFSSFMAAQFTNNGMTPPSGYTVPNQPSSGGTTQPSPSGKSKYLSTPWIICWAFVGFAVVTIPVCSITWWIIHKSHEEERTRRAGRYNAYNSNTNTQ